MKIITICGSLKFQNEMIEVAEKLELLENVVIPPIYPTNPDKDVYTDHQVDILDRMHKEKIKISDAIYVVDVNGYVGSSTKSEIEYAEKLGKEIMYYSKDNV